MNQPAVGTFLPLRILPTNEPFESVFVTILNWMKRTEQQAWQILPITIRPLANGIDERVASPYTTWGVGVDPLYLRYTSGMRYPETEDLLLFVDHHREWIETAAVYAALTRHLQTDDWRHWPDLYRQYTPDLIDEVNIRFPIYVREFYVDQYRLCHWLREVRTKLNEAGIELIGDLPFYIDAKSPLVWQHANLFELDSEYEAGMPAGLLFPRQAWGAPLYRWGEESERLLELFKLRMHWHGELFDYLRFDHSLGLFTSGRMHVSDPGKDSTVEGPGVEGFEQLVNVAEELGVRLIAEDLGDFDLTLLHECLDRHQIPGQRVFSMSVVPGLDHWDMHHADIAGYASNHVAYTSTHDTETLMGFLNSLSDEQILRLAKLAHIEYDKSRTHFARAIRQALIESPTHLTIIPIQDWLLTTDRLNRPGEVCDWQIDFDTSQIDNL